jgi:hypothetical protein
MADQNKFEEMLEKLVNEDRAGAEELFHEIVVEKSREIYENLLENDLEEESKDEEVEEASKDEDEETTEATDEEVDESSKDEEVDEAKDEEVDEASKDEEAKEGFDLDEFEVEPVEADKGDDFIDDVMDGGDEEGGDDMGGDDEAPADAEEMEDRLVDLEQELDKLRSEFEAEMGDGDDKGDDMDMDADDEEGEDDAEEESIDTLGMEATDEEATEATDEEVDETTDEEVDEGEKSEAEQMREYVEKVTATMGDNGANTKSPVAGKNDMGGDAGNLVKGGEADQGGTGAGAPKEDNAGNVNVPGGKAAKSMKNMPKGHGAEKKGAGETADNKKSTIGS